MKRFVYTPQIPTGKARTKGHGKTVCVYVIEADPATFKTLNSKHKVIKYFGTCRIDYGMVKGYSRKLIDRAHEFCKMVQLPEPRTTFEEF